MPKERKSPQEKKHLEYTRGHFTFTESVHGFRKTWPRKKAAFNRSYRRKSGEIFAQVKTGMPQKDLEAVLSEVTAMQAEKSVSRAKLHKWSTVPVGEKVKLKLQKRAELTGRRANRKRREDELAREAVDTLRALHGKELLTVVHRVAGLIRGGDPIKFFCLTSSTDPIDRALKFVDRVVRGGESYREALRRNAELLEAFNGWLTKADRLLARDGRRAEQKAAQIRALKTKIREQKHERKSI